MKYVSNRSIEFAQWIAYMGFEFIEEGDVWVDSPNPEYWTEYGIEELYSLFCEEMGYDINE